MAALRFRWHAMTTIRSQALPSGSLKLANERGK
jgi:hypothetical protein